MTRKILTAAMVVVALLISVLSLNATAAPTCPYNVAIIGNCAPAQPYPGPFTNMPQVPQGPYGFWSIYPGPVAPSVSSDGTLGSAAPLAVTGSESAVLGYIGTGLIAFGAVAMGSRRKFFQGPLD